MAYHFSANQFEDQYSPTKLGNWEYPKWYPERPRQRFKSTKPIADENGRLLEGIKRENPWGNYVGTWDLPRRITREYVKKLVAPPERLVNLWEKKKKAQHAPAEAVSKEEPPPDEQGKQSTARCQICNQPLSECTCHTKSETRPTTQCREGAETCGKREPKYLPSVKENSTRSAQKSFQRRNKSCSALDLRPRPTKLEPLNNLQEEQDDSHNIRPGTLDEKIKRILDSVEEKQPPPPSGEVICPEIKAFPRGPKDTLESGVYSNANQNDGKTLRERFESVEEVNYDKHPPIELENPEDVSESPKMKEDDKKSPESGKHEYVGYQIAKRYHDENLRHKPLPDVINDPVYKALASGRHPNPGEALSVQAGPSAIGWKCYTTPGPTECSKLRVYRPKTAIDKAKPQKETRPKTGALDGSTTKKRFLPIDLAICWDLKPEDPSDEPKRSPHIDGSNRSAAPAVFTMIRPSETADEPNVFGSSQAVVERISQGIDENNVATLPSQINGKSSRSPISMPQNKEAIMSCVKLSPETNRSHKSNTPESINSISTNAAEYARRNPKTAWSNEDTSKALSDRLTNLQKENMVKGSRETSARKKSIGSYQSDQIQSGKKNHHHSTPNLATACDGSNCGTEKNTPDSLSKLKCFSRNCGSAKTTPTKTESKATDVAKSQKQKDKKTRHCSACENPNSDIYDNRDKTEFKAAFKAGVPKSETSNSGPSSSTKSYRVPKMRLPYAKKSYSIGTLIPPFSFWPENNGQDYPEHWRLASVYQHSYKPINSRKRPLLAGVFQ